jgi:GWxTD domain-containing protein
LRKIFLLIIIFISSYIYCQKFNQNFFTDFYSFPSNDSTSRIFYFYKIPVNSLIFVKKSDSYFASLQISVEINDSNSNFIQRQFKDRNVIYNDFDSTVNPDNYIEGIIDFPLENRISNITSRFLDINSQKEIFIKDETILKNNNEVSEYLPPIILESKSISCESKTSNVLANYGGYIPFNNNSYKIFVPSIDTTLEKIFVKIVSNSDTIVNGLVDRSDLTRIGFAECNGNVVIKNDPSAISSSNFYIANITPKLKEGPFELIVSRTDDYKNKKSFKLFVQWFNKPRSLLDNESAIKSLRFVVKDDSIKKLLKSESNYDSSLYHFWKRIDPSTDTEYNELMAEYYTRIDYCMANFSTITGLKGTETDRAKIYILHGKPTNIERGSNKQGKVSETWTYIKPPQKFVFIDERGIGEFVLKSTQ